MEDDRKIVKSLGAVGTAFFGSFRELRDIQRRAIPPIRLGRDVLVTSATASGKTEAILAPLVARTLKQVPGAAPRVRILLIAPTRALVNDLTARIEGPLNRLGITCGRQTSDRRDKYKSPFVLVTTPESFDSMIVRDGRLEGGLVVDHLLAGVIGVFVDEAHLFDGTARGDQLSWLLGRLRRLRRLAEVGKTRSASCVLQICAGTATVDDPADLARRLVGPDAEIVRIEGTRDIEVLGPLAAPKWFRLEPRMRIDALRDRLETVSVSELGKLAARRIWQALASDGNAVRKVLVFVPTRSLCDTLSDDLSGALSRRRDLVVLAHHGSLSRNRRQEAEHRFARTRDAVMVATTTLEVGVDIGDVDMVALVGAPPDTRSLLQRIGRAGRRIGHTRLLALPRTEIERVALASLLLSARDGALEPRPYARRWSVFVQQTASFVAQGLPRGRRYSDLLDLAGDVWPEQPPGMARSIAECLVQSEFLVEAQGRLALGEPWADAFDDGGRGMHANLDSSGGGVPVVDSSTGVVIAHVAQRPSEHRDLSLAGQRWDVQNAAGGEILLKAKDASGGARAGFRYAARSAPTGQAYAAHVRRGLGLDERDAPLLDTSQGMILLHFGGSGYQTLLCALVPDIRPVAGLAGLAVVDSPVDSALFIELAAREDRLRHAVDAHFEALESIASTGPFQRYLPEDCRRRVVAELMDIHGLQRWLRTRRVWTMGRDDPRWMVVQAALFAGVKS